MLRVLMIVSGAVEAVFGLSALFTPQLVSGVLLGATADATALIFARIVGAATLSLGVIALLARNALDSFGGRAAAYGLALYNVLAAVLLVWTAAAQQGPAALWVAGLFHAMIGVLFLYALATARQDLTHTQK